MEKIISYVRAQWNRFRRPAQMEACLDSFLTFLTIELETGASFEKALARATESTPFPLQTTLAEARIRYHERGMPFEESIQKMGEHATPLVRQVQSMLGHAYTHGNSPAMMEAWKRILQRVREHQRVQWKKYSQKLVLFSLVFIGVSALVPALFLAFVTIGSRFLELSLSGNDILLFSLVGFPLLDAGILFLVWVQTPPVIHAQEKKNEKNIGEVIEEKKKRLEMILHANGIKEGISSLLLSATIESAGLFCTCHWF